MARLLLTLIVLANLTLVCQGHDEDGHHSDYHLTFMGEPAHDEESPVSGDGEADVPDSRIDDAPCIFSGTRPDIPGVAALVKTPSLPEVSSGQTETRTFSMLGTRLAALPGVPRAAPRPARIPSLSTLRPQLILSPFDPPPRSEATPRLAVV